MRNKYKTEKQLADQRVRWMVKHKVPYFQPTISPAPKNMERKEIESIHEAFNYYRDYTDCVLVQPKHMGSYCLAVLERDHKDSYFISRNGSKINHIEGLHEATENIRNNYYSSERCLIEGELMPWSAMGRGLIDREFRNYIECHRNKFNFLKDSLIKHKIQQIKKQKPWERDDLKPHEKRQYHSIRDLEFRDLASYARSIALYDKQLDIFASEEKLRFVPFNVLKTGLYKEQMFHKFGGEVISITNENRAYALFNDAKEKGLEGIVIKPFNQDIINVAPALKVRTNAYLQLIYGVEFDANFDYYLEKRNIKRKLEASIKGYEVARQLLSIPYSELHENNPVYVNLLYRAIDCERFVNTLDSRL